MSSSSDSAMVGGGGASAETSEVITVMEFMPGGVSNPYSSSGAFMTALSEKKPNIYFEKVLTWMKSIFEKVKELKHPDPLIKIKFDPFSRIEELLTIDCYTPVLGFRFYRNPYGKNFGKCQIYIVDKDSASEVAKVVGIKESIDENLMDEAILLAFENLVNNTDLSSKIIECGKTADVSERWTFDDNMNAFYAAKVCVKDNILEFVPRENKYYW